MILDISPEWLIYILPFVIEYVLKPMLGTLYSEIWNHVKKWWSNYRTRRHQGAMVRDGRQPSQTKELFFLTLQRVFSFLWICSLLLWLIN